jgi:hypothetical protein
MAAQKSSIFYKYFIIRIIFFITWFIRKGIYRFVVLERENSISLEKSKYNRDVRFFWIILTLDNKLIVCEINAIKRTLNKKTF